MILPRSGFGRGADSVVLVLFWVLGSVVAKDTAFVEVVLFESSSNGDYTTYTTGLQGRFSRAGATISAEGEIVQVRFRLYRCTCMGILPSNNFVSVRCIRSPQLCFSLSFQGGVGLHFTTRGWYKTRELCGRKMASCLAKHENVLAKKLL